MSTLEEELVDKADSISSDDIRTFTLKLLEVAPDSFWVKRASRDHHPPDERRLRGNLLHTARTVKLVKIMIDSCEVSNLEKDILVSAAILHDLCRNGIDGKADYTVEEHPALVRQVAAANGISCGCSEQIFTIIEKHMGRWGHPSYIPEVDPEAILHLADNISAHANEVWGKLN